MSEKKLKPYNVYWKRNKNDLRQETNGYRTILLLIDAKSEKEVWEAIKNNIEIECLGEYDKGEAM